jgi:hypothetical protein
MPKLLLAIMAALFSATGFAATPEESGSPQYELQVIHAKPGKLDEVHKWFAAHHQDVLAKHGAESMAYLVPVGPNPENKLLAVYKFPNLPAVLAFSRALKADPLWKPLDTASESPELLVEKIEVTGLSPTDYSPPFASTQAPNARVFELRTYTSPSPERLARLHARFREHTMRLFAKHGMENLVYWKPRDIEGSDRKLMYLLGTRAKTQPRRASRLLGLTLSGWLREKPLKSRQEARSQRKKMASCRSFSRRRTIRRCASFLGEAHLIDINER